MTREDAGVVYEIRALTVDDLPDSWEITRIAFGSSKEAPPGWLTERPGRVTWGVFDARGRLVAKAMDRDQRHWFGGRLVPATGLAGVVTVPELRGTGLGRMALTRTLHAAHERGAVIATLFRSGPGPYRSLGCEEVGALTWTAVPAAAFTAVKGPPDVTLRAAEPGDAATVDKIYRTVARASAGMLERSGSIFEGLQTLERVDGVTLAVGSGGVEGYTSWDREPGYDASGRLAVFDLIGLTAGATRALLANLGPGATWRRRSACGSPTAIRSRCSRRSCTRRSSRATRGCCACSTRRARSPRAAGRRTSPARSTSRSTTTCARGTPAPGGWCSTAAKGGSSPVAAAPCG